MNNDKTVLKKLLRRPNIKPQWAEFGPRAVLCPPLIYYTNYHGFNEQSCPVPSYSL